jgi:dTDP-4-dehydrorhamnose reductase
MKILITGADGQLGTDLCKTLGNHNLIPLVFRDLDITDLKKTIGTFMDTRPDVVINTAAFVRVDDCETEPDTAYTVNALGARNVAVAAADAGTRLVHISTDYVFGGEGQKRTTPYTEFDTPVPLSVYGRSKLAGEDLVRHACPKHFIIRSSALFGLAGSMGKGGNFVETIIRMAKDNKEMSIVNDQVFSPTYTPDLSQRIADLIESEYYGIIHITNSGICSWYEFAAEILKLAGSSTPLQAIRSEDYPQKATRPAYSVLDNYQTKLLHFPAMRPWQAALRDYMEKRNN